MGKRKLLALVGLLFSCSVSGLQVSGLYEARVPVQDQGETQRRQAIQIAIRTVLIKLTGSRIVLTNPQLKSLFNTADQYILQYRYQAIHGKSEGDGDGMELSIRFDQYALDKWLHARRIPLWGQERPSVLIWLAVKMDDTDRMSHLGDGMGYLEALDRSAGLRGIVFVYPLMDLEDTAQVKADDVCRQANPSIIHASRRYPADIALSICLIEERSGRWWSKWTKIDKGKDLGWTVQGHSPEETLRQGVDRLVDILASDYIQKLDGNKSTRLALLVSNIKDFEQYVATLRYLNSLNAVTQVGVQSLYDDRARFELETLGGEKAITQVISLGKTLKRVPNNEHLEFKFIGE